MLGYGTVSDFTLRHWFPNTRTAISLRKKIYFTRI